MPERQNSEMDETLRPLTSLKWPYVPEESAYADPLKRDDPKVVQLPQYEAIGDSPLFISCNNRSKPRLHQPLLLPSVKYSLIIQT